MKTLLWSWAIAAYMTMGAWAIWFSAPPAVLSTVAGTLACGAILSGNPAKKSKVIVTRKAEIRAKRRPVKAAVFWLAQCFDGIWRGIRWCLAEVWDGIRGLPANYERRPSHPAHSVKVAVMPVAASRNTAPVMGWGAMSEREDPSSWRYDAQYVQDRRSEAAAYIESRKARRAVPALSETKHSVPVRAVPPGPGSVSVDEYQNGKRRAHIVTAQGVKSYDIVRMLEPCHDCGSYDGVAVTITDPETGKHLGTTATCGSCHAAYLGKQAQIEAEIRKAASVPPARVGEIKTYQQLYETLIAWEIERPHVPPQLRELHELMKVAIRNNDMVAAQQLKVHVQEYWERPRVQALAEQYQVIDGTGAVVAEHAGPYSREHYV